jgi:hypothetical protein
MMYIKNFAYGATQIMELKVVCDNTRNTTIGRVWHSLQCSLAVLVVWFVSHRRCRQTEILEARNIEFVSKVLLFNLIIYYRKENCILLGYYTVSSVKLIPTFRTNHSHLQDSCWHTVVVPSQR